jgi:hypothetical protein
MFAILSKKPSLLKALKAIPEITVRVGPYYDTDDAIAVLCTEQLGTTQPILDRLEELRTMNRKDSLPEIHVLMGTLLGYTCPIDLEALYKEPSLYDIGFVIDDIAHMPVWCPKKAKYATTARKQLRAINQALKPLGKKATLSLKAIKGVRLHTTRKKKRQS